MLINCIHNIFCSSNTLQNISYQWSCFVILLANIQMYRIYIIFMKYPTFKCIKHILYIWHPRYILLHYITCERSKCILCISYRTAAGLICFTNERYIFFPILHKLLTSQIYKKHTNTISIFKDISKYKYNDIYIFFPALPKI